MPQPFDVRKLAYDLTLQHLPLAHTKRQDLGWDESANGQPIWVTGLESTLIEALSNIIHNAIRYTPPSGHITVSAKVIGSEAVLSVRDTGPGIAPAMRIRVFERFRRGDDQGHDGAGLGLAIAREFATLNHGRVELSDGDENGAGGCGLCVRIYVPLARASRPTLEAA